MKKLVLSAAVGTALICAAPLHAEEEHRQLGAHIHGHGTLNIAIEGGKVAMELVAPGMDIVGFEHAANTDKQKALVKKAIDTLEKDALTLFAVSEAAKCSVVKAKAELEGAEEHGESEEHKDHDHEKEAKKDDHDHDHDKEAKKDDHDHDHEKEAKKDDHDHDHEKKAEHDGEAEHREFHVAYELTCAAPAELKTLDLHFFKQFPNSKELMVTVVDATGAKKLEATPANPQIQLAK